MGYQGLSIEEFCDTLERHGVEVLIDVRERAWSHRPEYRKGALSEALSERGIAYRHLRDAGNPHRPRKGHPLPMKECIRLYGEHLDDNPHTVQQVALALESAPSAVFCYEAGHDDCHRSILLQRVDEVIKLDITEA